MRFIVEKLQKELRSESELTKHEHNESKSAPTRSIHQDLETKCTVDSSRAFVQFPQEESCPANKPSIQEEQSLGAAQLVTAQEAQASYDNFDRAIEHIQLAKNYAASKDEEMRELKSKYEDKCKEVTRLTNELEQSQQEKQQLCNKISKLETEAKEYKTKVDHLEAEVGDLKSRVKTLEDSIKDKEVEKERLLKEKAMMETELVRKDLELWKSAAEKEQLKREAAENQSRITVFQAQEEIERVRRESVCEIESLQRQLSLQSLGDSELQKQSIDKDAQIESLRKELEVLKSQSH